MAFALAVPGALTALVGVLRNTSALAGATVYDGRVVTSEDVDQAVIVGDNGPQDVTAADGKLDPAGLAIIPDQEGFTIRCAAFVVDGTEDMTAARTRVFELVNAVGQILAGDPTLGGAVGMAYVSEWRLTYPQTSAGALAEVLFGITVKAFTRS